MLSSLVTAHCLPLFENAALLRNILTWEREVVGRCKIWRVRWVVNSNVPVHQEFLYNYSVMRWNWRKFSE
jgi:hypothetical protein